MFGVLGDMGEIQSSFWQLLRKTRFVKIDSRGCMCRGESEMPDSPCRFQQDLRMALTGTTLVWKVLKVPGSGRLVRMDPSLDKEILR